MVWLCPTFFPRDVIFPVNANIISNCRHGDSRRLVENGLICIQPHSVQFGPHHPGSNRLLRPGLAHIPTGRLTSFGHLYFILLVSRRAVQYIAGNISGFAYKTIQITTLQDIFDLVSSGCCSMFGVRNGAMMNDAVIFKWWTSNQSSLVNFVTLACASFKNMDKRLKILSDTLMIKFDVILTVHRR